MNSHHASRAEFRMKQGSASGESLSDALLDNASRDYELVRSHLFSGSESESGIELNIADGDKLMIHCEIVHWVREICKSTGDIFDEGDVIVDSYDLSNRAARKLQSFLEIDVSAIVCPDADMEISLEEEVFLSAVAQAIEEGLNPHRLLPSASKSLIKDWIESRNGLIDKIRFALSDPEIKRRRKNQMRTARENLKSILSGMVAAFEKHSKILALRFDVGFHKPVEHPSLQPKLDFDAVHMAREKLLKHIDRRFGEALVWYVWKIEYGQEKGFHIHWLVFLNGSIHSRDGHLVKEIGEFWKTQVVPGSGIYFNCSVLKQQYRSCGIGPLDASDPKIWSGLGFIAQYFTKLEQLVGRRVSGRRRSMSTGQIKPAEGQKPGPKRKTGLQLPPDIRRLVFGS